MKDELIAVLDKQLLGEYFTAKELEYSSKAGTYISPLDYKLLVEAKENGFSDDKYAVRLPLRVFNGKCLYYSRGNDLATLIDTYLEISKENALLNNHYSESFVRSRIYSEIEGSLNVENIPTTRRRLKELIEGEAEPENENDVIIKNMKVGIDFVNSLPPFEKDNLHKLYSILSNGCLAEENKIRDDEYYRYDQVEIDRYSGCPVKDIENCIDSLFEYANRIIKVGTYKEKILLPHICHYYLLYVHPYFDYNGRTARMVSYWIGLLCGSDLFLPIVSEAINQTKNKYYQALELTRDSNNDVTYFLKYVLGVSIDCSLCYQNIERIASFAKNKGYVLTETEENHVKRILISYEGLFSYLDFLKMTKATMSKQGALKILNRMVDYGFLIEAKSNSKNKLFDINKSKIEYSLRYFGYRRN